MEETMALRHWQQSLSIGPSVRVSDGRPRSRGVISGWSNYVRRSSARVTSFCASISYAVTASHDIVTFKKLQTYGSLIYVVLHVMQYN